MQTAEPQLIGSTILTPGRFRWRTRLRGALPSPWWRLVPKGRADCGNHVWYFAGEGVDRCYHCEAGCRVHDSLIAAAAAR